MLKVCGNNASILHPKKETEMEVFQFPMARSSILPIKRLCHQIWIRAALIRYITAVERGDVSPRNPIPGRKGTWEWFSVELFGDEYPDDRFEENTARNLLSVANDGSDPRTHKRYIRINKFTPHHLYVGCPTVKRKPGGPTPKKESTQPVPVDHYVVEIDLVKKLEDRLPGSALWESAFLWELANPQQLLSVETLRLAINDHLRVLNLVRPSIAQRRHFLTEEEFDRFRKVGFDEQKRRYAKALLPLTECICPRAISLLAALCAESYLADNDTLFELHRDAMEVAIRNLLAHDLMKDVAHDFVAQVAVNILDGYGREFDLPQPSSLSAPLMPMEDWERQTGASWVSIPDLG